MNQSDSSRFYDLFRNDPTAFASSGTSPYQGEDGRGFVLPEDGHQQLDNIVDPSGWIGEAFDLQEQDLEAIKADIQGLRAEMNGKLDLILSHLTGLDRR